MRVWLRETNKFRSCRAHFSTGSALGSASMLLQSLSNKSSPNIDEKNPGMAFMLLLPSLVPRPKPGNEASYMQFQNFKTCIISDI